MEDKVITIVFGSLGASITLVGVLFAYLQLRGSRHYATAPDEERAVPPVAVVQEQPVTNPTAVMVQKKPVTNPP
jgi:hypothetical protein